MLDDAIARPGEVIISQAGNNNANQACIGVLCEEAGIQFNNIPYDGASRVLTEIIGGHIEAGCMKPADCLSQVQSGEVEIVAFFTRDRVELYMHTLLIEVVTNNCCEVQKSLITCYCRR